MAYTWTGPLPGLDKTTSRERYASNPYFRTSRSRRQPSTDNTATPSSSTAESSQPPPTYDTALSYDGPVDPPTYAPASRVEVPTGIWPDHIVRDETTVLRITSDTSLGAARHAVAFADSEPLCTIRQRVTARGELRVADSKGQPLAASLTTQRNPFGQRRLLVDPAGWRLAEWTGEALVGRDVVSSLSFFDAGKGRKRNRDVLWVDTPREALHMDVPERNESGVAVQFGERDGATMATLSCTPTRDAEFTVTCLAGVDILMIAIAAVQTAHFVSEMRADLSDSKLQSRQKERDRLHARAAQQGLTAEGAHVPLGGWYDSPGAPNYSGLGNTPNSNMAGFCPM